MASIYRFANPQKFESIAARVQPWLFAAAAAALACGLYLGLVVSPVDYQQKDTVRIMYVHVPAAWMAMFCYTTMAIASFIGFVLKHPLADIAAKAMAPIGAGMTALALVTGMLWGKPTWGTYWVWDARLTSVLVLFFLYLGYMGLWEAIEDWARAARAAAILAMVGFINVPIIKFSVDWWFTLHQPASVTRFDSPAIHSSILTPLLVMGVAYLLFVLAVHILRMRMEVLDRRLHRLRQAQSDGSAAPATAAVEVPS